MCQGASGVARGGGDMRIGGSRGTEVPPAESSGARRQATRTEGGVRVHLFVFVVRTQTESYVVT